MMLILSTWYVSSLKWRLLILPTLNGDILRSIICILAKNRNDRRQYSFHNTLYAYDYYYWTYHLVFRWSLPLSLLSLYHLTHWAVVSVSWSIRLLQTRNVIQSQHTARFLPGHQKVWEKQNQCKSVVDFPFFWQKGTGINVKKIIVTHYFVENTTDYSNCRPNVLGYSLHQKSNPSTLTLYFVTPTLVIH